MASRGKLRIGEPTVPAAPFSGWLRDRIAEYEASAATEHEKKQVGASVRLAAELGWGTSEGGVRRLYRYKNAVKERTAKSKTVKWNEAASVWPRSDVEDACHNIDPDLFYELYPEFRHERDIDLEPDAWCPFCKEMVTPVDGLCPWCVCDHGHLFREVGITEDGYACLACLRKERRERATAAEQRKRAA